MSNVNKHMCDIHKLIYFSKQNNIVYIHLNTYNQYESVKQLQYRYIFLMNSATRVLD